MCLLCSSKLILQYLYYEFFVLLYFNQKSRKTKFSTKKVDAFEKYIKNMEQNGTYADNGCLVAFARLYQVNINIHQLNMPVWTINGVFGNKMRPRELHLSYHNGEHYSSIRPIGDRTNAPANVLMKQNSETFNDSFISKNANSKNKSQFKYQSNSMSRESCYLDQTEINLSEGLDGVGDYDECKFNEKVDEIIEITKCMDINLIKDLLVQNNYDSEDTINSLISQANTEVHYNECKEKSKPPKVANGSDKKMEKKMRQMERQRIKVIENSQEKHDKSNSKSEETSSNQTKLKSNQLVQKPSSLIIQTKSI